MPAIGPLGENLTFLLGLPRSGTTLLSVMLDNHPAMASPPEPWVMLALEQLGQVEIRHPANPQVLGTAVRRFAGQDGLIPAAREAGRALYGAHLAGCGKTVFVDKTPRYLLIPDYLHTVFPQARLLWLIRDPFDVAASYRTTWGMNLPAILAENRDVPELFDLTVGLDRLEALRDRLGDAVHVIGYERLVADPAGVLGVALRHLGQADDPDTIDRMCTLETGRRAAGFGDPKIHNTTAPKTDSIGTWRTVFTPAELQVLLDAVGTERLHRLGYGATVAALADMSIRESAPDAHQGYLARATAHLAARLNDIARITTHTDGDDILSYAQARLHAALNDDPASAPPPTHLPADLPAHLLADAAVADANAARQAAEAEVERLRTRLAGEIAAHNRQLSALLTSPSWRLTAPLRRLAGWFRPPSRQG